MPKLTENRKDFLLVPECHRSGDKGRLFEKNSESHGSSELRKIQHSRIYQQKA
ncbi:MAG: hypothetical protein PWP56_2091 [Acetobacterium sp.]|jgi:hypothetical protein|nr:hypothetical protein [Eubacteriaceae bacterium]MDK2904394.1 hypothetical protein [Eubacteriaceae bacterium]MDK2942578.1 hypothetical protein [Acetobacterium sp.]